MSWPLVFSPLLLLLGCYKDRDTSIATDRETLTITEKKQSVEQLCCDTIFMKSTDTYKTKSCILCMQTRLYTRSERLGEPQGLCIDRIRG